MARIEFHRSNEGKGLNPRGRSFNLNFYSSVQMFYTDSCFHPELFHGQMESFWLYHCGRQYYWYHNEWGLGKYIHLEIRWPVLWVKWSNLPTRHTHDSKREPFTRAFLPSHARVSALSRARFCPLTRAFLPSHARVSALPRARFCPLPRMVLALQVSNRLLGI